MPEFADLLQQAFLGATTALGAGAPAAPTAEDIQARALQIGVDRVMGDSPLAGFVAEDILGLIAVYIAVQSNDENAEWVFTYPSELRQEVADVVLRACEGYRDRP